MGFESQLHRRKHPLARWATAVLIVVFTALLIVGKLAGFGCAGANRAAIGPATQVTSGELMTGQWLGTWASSKSDMGGQLRCSITPLGERSYEAVFDAVFAKILNNHSVVKLHVQSKGNVWEFTGEEDLGLLKGGIYKYAGTCDGHNFICSYDSAFDKGTFKLARLSAPTRPSQRP